jgi:prepilin-type N-terminal cleavage/methylation domain-containing protein
VKERHPAFPIQHSMKSAIRNPQSAMGARAFTLVEMLVVVVIVSIMSVAIVAEMHGTYQDALLRATGRELAAACNGASSRAISVNRPHRVHLDTLAHRWLLERGTRAGSDFFPVKDVPGGSGTLDARITINILEPGVNSPDDAGNEPPGGSGNTGELPSSGLEDAITFYEDGTADARQIVLADRDGFRLALRINPITSRVQITAMGHP